MGVYINTKLKEINKSTNKYTKRDKYVLTPEQREQRLIINSGHTEERRIINKINK